VFFVSFFLFKLCFSFGFGFGATPESNARMMGMINGVTGWRQPTQTELSALYASGAMNGQGWTLTVTWSSTPHGVGSHENVSLSNGQVVYYGEGRVITAEDWTDSSGARPTIIRASAPQRLPATAKPLLARAMGRLANPHTSALLWTNTTCGKAIQMYLDFGFKPLLISERWQEAWRMMAEELKHPALSVFAKKDTGGAPDG